MLHVLFQLPLASLIPQKRLRFKCEDEDSRVEPPVAPIWFESTTPPYHRSSSAVDAEGKFELGFIHAGSGSTEGEHRIRIEPANPGALPAQEALAKRMNARYYEYATSGLKQTIAKTTNEFVIEVEGPGR